MSFLLSMIMVFGVAFPDHVAVKTDLKRNFNLVSEKWIENTLELFALVYFV